MKSSKWYVIYLEFTIPLNKRAEPASRLNLSAMYHPRVHLNSVPSIFAAKNSLYQKVQLLDVSYTCSCRVQEESSKQE